MVDRVVGREYLGRIEVGYGIGRNYCSVYYDYSYCDYDIRDRRIYYGCDVGWVFSCVGGLGGVINGGSGIFR